MEKCNKNVIGRCYVGLLRTDLVSLNLCLDHVDQIFNGDLTRYFDEGDRPDPDLKFKLYTLLCLLNLCLDSLGDVVWDLDNTLPGEI